MLSLRKWKPLLPLLLVAGFLFIIWQIFGGVVLSRYYQIAAEQALEAGSAERAALLREKQLSQTPRDEALRLSVCALYIELGNYSRAEYILQNGIRVTGPSTTLYTELSRVFVLQDKLQDAVNLMTGITSQPVSQALSAARPPVPLPDTAPGTYNERIYLNFDVPEGSAVYVSIDGEVPSVTRNLYTEPIVLPDGLSEMRAVMVNAEGLASEWAAGYYTLENVVYPVTFADATLESLVRETIGKPEGELYTEDLWNLETLFDTEPGHYTTLEDLRYLPSLRTLSLTGDRGDCDISALSGASALRELRLEAFGLQSLQLSALSPLVFLESLDLSDNNIAMLDALSGMTGLRTLNLSRNSLIWLEPLSGLTGLTVLDLSQNAISEILPLTSLSHLEKLLLSRNNLSLLEGLQSLTLLHTLDISENIALETIDEVRSLTRLEWFSAAGCSLYNLPAFQGFSVLRYVSLERNRLASLEGLETAAALETLNARQNQIISLLPLAQKDALRVLDLSDNALTSVEELAALPALEEVLLSGNSLTTILPLQNCPSLKRIEAYGNNLSDPLSAWEESPVDVSR